MAQQGGYGVVVKIDTGSLTTVANLLSTDFPEFEKILAESTSHGSTSGYAEWIATGKRQLNEFTMVLGWDVAEATHAQVVTSFDADASVDMSIEDPDGSEVIAFAAHIRTVNRIGQQDGMFQAEVRVQPTGAPTIT